MRSGTAQAPVRDTHVKSSFRGRLMWSLAMVASAGVVVGFAGGCATASGPELRAPSAPRSETRTAGGWTERAPTDPAPSTGRVFTRTEMRQQTSTNYFGDEAYAEVNSAWLPAFQEEFRRELHRLGIVRWNERFDCNRFTELFIALAQARFYRETFHSDTAARALAMGPYWYVRDDGNGTHAVVQVLTERGRIFVDPQSGEEVKLSRQETSLGYFQYF